MTRCRLIRFWNPHGLDYKGNLSTSYDVSKLCYSAFKNDKFKKIVGTKKYEARIFRAEEVVKMEWRNSNLCLHNFDTCIGIKTGVTPESGFCLATYWKFPSKEFIIILNSCATAEQRFSESRNLAYYLNDLKSN